MRFSLFAILSSLAALTVVSALPAENLQRDVPPEVNVPTSACNGCIPTVSFDLDVDALTAGMYSPM